MLSALKAIIFDHDGTLVDSEPVHFACWNQVLSRYNSRFEFSDYNTHLNGLPSIESAQWIIQHCGLDITAEALYAQKQTQLEHYLMENAFPLMEGARELLQTVAAAGFQLAVASGAGRLEINHSLTSHGLNDLLPVTASKNDVTRNKPAPDVYLLAAERLGIAPQQALAIEDSDAGQAAALAAGMYCFRLDANPRVRPNSQHPRVKMFDSLEAMRQALSKATPAR